MKTEYEVRVLDINKELLEKKLVALGAKKVAEFDYKRRVYDFNPRSDNKWIRLRTDGEKTTLTIKEVENKNIDGTKESEIMVSSFEETNIMLNKMGYFSHSYQESKRTRYLLDEVEIDFDTWPYIPTYMEVEGNSVKEVETTLERLDINKEEVTSLDVQTVFNKFYKIDVAKMPELKFGMELEEKYKIKD